MILKREMAISRNIYVNPPEADKSSELLVRRTTEYVSAQFLDFLDLAKNCSFLNWKHIYIYHLNVISRENYIKHKTIFINMD